MSALVAGERHSAAVTNRGDLYVWGASPHGFEDMLTPVVNHYANGIVKLEMSKEHLIALDSTVSDCFYVQHQLIKFNFRETFYAGLSTVLAATLLTMLTANYFL